MSDDKSGYNRSGNKNGDEEGLNRYLDALASPRRRYSLYYLKNEKVATVSDIAIHVTAYETDRSPAAVTEQESQSVHTDLKHNHLPRLADYGLIDFDSRMGDVRFADPPPTLRILLVFCQLVENRFD